MGQEYTNSMPVQKDIWTKKGIYGCHTYILFDSCQIKTVFIFFDSHAKQTCVYLFDFYTK